MDLRKTGIIAAISAVAVVSTAAGVRGRVSTPPAPVVAAEISVQPVVVVAHKPSLPEIVDLVLHERSTAEEEAHVAKVLSRYNRDESLVERIAASLVKEGKRRHIGASLLVGVLLTENPDLNPRAKSIVGARGLMQVMPFHAGKWGCGSRDLFDVESNICHGVAVLADNLGGARNLPQALLGYNGCVRGTNTPDCKRYPRIVYGRARKGEDSTSKAFAQ